MVRLRKCLHNPVVGNGDSFMSPLVGTFNQGFCVRYPVHIAHFCMAVKLHTLLWIIIRTAVFKAGNFLNPHNRAYGKLAVISVNSGNSLQLYKRFFLNAFCNLLYLIVSGKHFYGNGVCKIGNRKDNNRFFVSDFSLFQGHNLSSDTDLSHFCLHVFQWNYFVIKVPSIQYIRIVRAFYTAFKVRKSTFCRRFFLLRLCLFFFLLFYRSFLRFFFYLLKLLFFFSERGHFYNMSRFLCNADIAVFSEFTFLYFLIFCLYF